jgi:hypothetical protein
VEIFFEKELGDFLNSLRSQMRATVNKEPAEYLFNVNEDEYAEHLLSQFQLIPLCIHFDKMYVSAREERIAGERFPGFDFDRDMMRGKSYPRQVVRYHIPYEGTEELLHCIPNPRLMHTHPVELEGGCICFDIIDFHSDPERIKRESNQIVSLIQRQAENVDKNVTEYNKALPGEIRQTITERKKQLQSQQGVVASLGLPIKKSPNIPETFRVPEVRKTVLPRPSIPAGIVKPEPTLGDDIYQEILQVIHDTGKVFERLPSTYAGKDEETLRDHLILQLEPRFEGSTTGETFNKTGKTDILIRHEKSNIFVAECKYWDGVKKHLDALDQLLGYLTWRDSKAALVCFVDRKDFSNVLKQIAEVTKQHPCFVRYVGAKEETWLNFEFHLPGDPDRKLKVAILAFHLPRS